MGVKPKIQGPGGEGFLPIYAFTDSMALKDHLYSPRHLVLDRRLGALVSSLKDMVTQDGVKCRHVRLKFLVSLAALFVPRVLPAPVLAQSPRDCC